MKKQTFKLNQRVFIKPVKRVGVIKSVENGKIKVAYFDKDDKRQFIEVTYKDLAKVRKKFTVPYKKLADDAVEPKYQTKGASGFDIHAYTNGETFTVKPGERKLIATRLAFAVPKGYELQLRPRSGLALEHGITITNSPATIDSDYRGEVGVIIQNTGEEDFVINHGDRICQGVITPVKQARFIAVEELNKTERGTGGFGHTGTK